MNSLTRIHLGFFIYGLFYYELFIYEIVELGLRMETYRVGLLYSTDGTYRRIASNALLGASYAIEQVNADDRYPFQLEGVHVDPKGNLDQYINGAQSLLKSGIRHIAGTITSSARKEVIPDVHEHQALLWYGSPYEGYECDEHVVYHGACPNQNLLQILRYAVPRFGKRVALLGSNYIWGWESNRIARDAIDSIGGEIIEDTYYRFDTTDFRLSIENIKSQKPDFVINNLVGESSYAFLHQLNDAWSAESLPVLSSNLSECELASIRALPNLRLFTALTFFQSVNPQFTEKVKMAMSCGEPVSSNFVGAYLSILSLANAIAIAGSDDVTSIRAVLGKVCTDTPMGHTLMIAKNQHAILPCFIGERDGDDFKTVKCYPPIEPNPYLIAQQFLTDIERLTDIETVNSSVKLRVVK
ncbi:putative ABC-type branched-chain amino acid transport systems, periplasmic component [Vibrio nigripulchritudo SFn27]|nr:transporter substrate-binding domain-containing protein [Vibrio nigripulchritudo]CCN90664.1 putative ABC-type branched-chain amino acid transport systems, periplasmic component [Vibrio nigripulchritudo SFn27]CCO39886.1 putative ABC-type branched-chain amino acid transport systems, periplasmic component [Vibrio nigripulchritudo SFn135]CCN83068.1 putative ABC-type branched-chain amino acid transport systems, periplasmic component [Vibrio nigripulchritudo BLFn1]CCN97251.1 putative ABC-type bran